MILGVGIDVISIAEIQSQIDELDNYVTEIFTPHEIAYCRSRPNPYSSFAARFAAKEAFMKAARTGWTDEVDFLQIEVHNNSASAPELYLNEMARSALTHLNPFQTHLTLSHTDQLAIAVVVLDQ